MVVNSAEAQPGGRSGSEPGGPGGDGRAAMHDMWGSVAGSWAEHAAFVDGRNRVVAERMLDLSMAHPGHRVLELACGPGGVGLAAAARVAPDGEVVLSDVAAAMTEIAAARAASLGIANVTTMVLDLERIEQPDGLYDVVLCRDGLQFALDPSGALRQMRRVLRPGGRVAVAAWGPRSENPWLGVVFDAVSAQLGVPMPPAGRPGPFSLGRSDTLVGLLRAAGLGDVTVEEVPVPLLAASFEAWWTTTTALAGPLARVLSALPEDAARAVRARADDGARPYRTATGLEFPGLALVASGRRGEDT